MYLRSFKQVLTNRSATKCLVAQFFFVGTAIAVFPTTFFATQFSASIGTRSYIVAIAASIYVAASLIAGRLVNKFGAKHLAIVGSILQGFFLMALFFAPNLLISVAFDLASACFSALAFSALNCLALDQVPESRGTMVSMTRIFGKLGDAAVPAIAGLLFLFSSYQLLGVLFVSMNVIAAIFFLLAKDPTKLDKA